MTYLHFEETQKFRQVWLWIPIIGSSLFKVEKAEVIKYNPIGDFGGWGIKSGRKGKACNVSGNMGLYLPVVTCHPSPVT